MRRKILFVICGVIVACVIAVIIAGKMKVEKVKEKKFVPPPDGIITKEMADKYLLATKYLREAIEEHKKDIMRMAKIHGVTPEELESDTLEKTSEKVQRLKKRLLKKWRKRELEAYKRAGITEEEFNWIGQMLTDTTKNKEIRKYIQKKFLEMFQK